MLKKIKKLNKDDNTGQYGRSETWFILLLALLSLVLILIVRETSQAKVEIEIQDILSEGMIVVLALFWVLLIQRIRNEKNIYYPLIIGFTLLFWGNLSDVLDEFWEQGEVYKVFENIFTAAGMISASVGFHSWTRKLRKSNALLENNVRERTRELEEKSATLEASLKEKEALLKEVNHRVKNNIQLVSSLIKLQMNTVEGEEAREFCLELSNRINTLGMVHQMLYQSKDLSAVHAPTYFETLANYLTRIFEAEKIHLVSRIADISLGAEKAILAGLIVNELISNSIKHAFPGTRKGQIELTIEEQEMDCVLMIRDDGIGLPPSLDFASLDAVDSLGLKIVTVLTKQLNGELRVERNQGTAFFVRFRLAGAQ